MQGDSQGGALLQQGVPELWVEEAQEDLWSLCLEGVQGLRGAVD